MAGENEAGGKVAKAPPFLSDLPTVPPQPLGLLDGRPDDHALEVLRDDVLIRHGQGHEHADLAGVHFEADAERRLSEANGRQSARADKLRVLADLDVGDQEVRGHVARNDKPFRAKDDLGLNVDVRRA